MLIMDEKNCVSKFMYLGRCVGRNDMNYRLYKEENYSVSNWTGGTTKQLAIFPEEGNYLERDFVWRISSATVENEESNFSKLPDYDRVLVVLQGDVVLAHDGQRVARLKELEQDRFDGAYKTKSFGKITDYNLMVSKGNQGFVEVMTATEISQIPEITSFPEYELNTQAYYCRDGFATVTINGEMVMIKAGEQLVVDFKKGEHAQISIMGDGTILRTQIFYNYNRGEYGATIIPNQKPTFSDFKTCLYLSSVQFRGAKYIFRQLKDQWFDQELKKAIRKVEKPCIPFFVWVLGIVILSWMGIENFDGAAQWVISMGLWSIVDVLIISPLIYLFTMPKPVKEHIKDIHNLTPYEQKVLEEELCSNERLDKILKKYKSTGRYEYDENGNRINNFMEK